MSVRVVSSVYRTVAQNRNSFLCHNIAKSVSCRFKSYEAEGKTTINILNKDPASGLMIDAFSQIGFRLNNGIAVLGSMAIFPKTVLSWNVGNVNDINEESLSLFCCLEPKIDILILGVGDNNEFLKFNKNIIKFLRDNRISVETLPTETACTTFNFLNAERRYVAGALIPPTSLKMSSDYISASKLREQEAYDFMK